MVSRTRNAARLFLLCTLLAPHCATAGAASLTAHVSATELEFGRAITLQLEAQDSAQKLIDMDLAPLAEDFGMENLEYGVSGPTTARRIQRLTLQLYPRRSGAFTLPALALGDLHSTPIALHVSPAAERGTPFMINSTLSAAAAYARQQVIWTVELHSPKAFFSVDVAAPTIAGFEVIPLAASRHKESRDDTSYTVQRLAWAVFPLRTGSHTLRLPPLKYSTGGRVDRTFYLPTQQLDVRPLPPYLPPTIPVGTVSLSATLTPEPPLRRDRLAYWHITVHGRGIPASWLPPILRTVKSDDNLHFFAPVSERANELSDTELRSTAHYRIPFTPTAIGRLTLPEITLQYFDPSTGRIVRVTHAATPVTSLSPVAIITAAALALAALILTLRPVARYLTRWQRRQRQRRAALRALATATDAHALRHALVRIPVDNTTHAPHTAHEWLMRWQTRHGTHAPLAQCIERLNRACYGPARDPDLAQLKSTLRREVLHKARRPRTVRTDDGALWLPEHFIPTTARKV